MAVFNKEFLSQSANGRPIMVTVTSSPPQLIHTTLSTNTDIDEIWLYASNNTNNDSYLTIYWGSSASSDLVLNVNIEAYAGAILVIPGLILQGDGSNSNRIFATTTIASAIDIVGYVNRISP